MNPIEKISKGSYSERQLEFERRIAANCHQANYRKQLATELKSLLQIDSNKGFLKISPFAYPEIQDIIDEAEDFKKQNADKTSKKTIIGRLFNSKTPTKKIKGRTSKKIKPENFNTSKEFLDNPLVRLALREEVIKVVADYFGYIPIIGFISYWYNANEKTESDVATISKYYARRYHLDHGDNSMIKLFVYGSDVNKENGVLHIINANKSNEIREAINYKYIHGEQSKPKEAFLSGNSYYVQDEVITQHLKDGEEITLDGEKGSCYFVETSQCYHYGGRNLKTGKERLIGVIQYLRPGALKFATEYNDTPPFGMVNGEHLTELQRLVLGNRLDLTT